MRVSFEIKEEIIERSCEKMGFEVGEGKEEIMSFFEMLDREENYILMDRVLEELLVEVLNV